MPSIDVVDETFLAVPPERVAAEFADPALWRRLWPDLDLEVMADRGAQGIRWTVTGALVGSMEVWLERVLDGTVLHYFLRAEPAGRRPADPAGRAGARAARRDRSRASARQREAKALAVGLKRHLDRDRPAGVPPADPGPREHPETVISPTERPG